MECNKDEAIRAKELSEKKMADNDFEGARKIALKAQTLYPELENITQLLSICDVHCSAQKRILGSEKDWYSILQVERLADELTIKKQYRRLALILHPDKNRFPGAEAAFKLICEANAVLSDATKKSVFDAKIRMSVISAPKRPPPHHMNKSVNFNQQYNAQVNVTNGFRSMNQHQAPQATFSVRPQVFWTSCPFCRVQYQYQRQHVNKSLRCPSCLKHFMAIETNGQAGPMGSKVDQPGSHVPLRPGLSRPASFQERVVPNHNYAKVGVQNAKGSSASSAGSQGTASRKTVLPERGVHVTSAPKDNGYLKANGVPSNRESDGWKNRSKKRGRDMIEESSESFDSSSDSDLGDEAVEETSGNTASGLNSGTDGGNFRRRSSRVKQNISYNESDDDDNFVSPVEASRNVKDSKEQKDALHSEDSNGNQNSFPEDKNYFMSKSKERGAVRSEESLRDKDANRDTEIKATGGKGVMSSSGAETVDIGSDSDLDHCSSDDMDGNKYECPDPEFYDFEKARDASLGADQVWACYDELDSMPRFYAKVIKKVSDSPFEVVYKWLEANPVDAAFDDWLSEKLPIGCGTYKLGRKTQSTDCKAQFSHQMVPCEGKKRGSFIIYPRKGEVWALLKDWRVKWSLNPEDHREYKYEIVEVLSDFDSEAGIEVCYLDKVAGFVSLFHRSSQCESDSFLIGPDELLKFSHCVPSFKLTGSERDGVPIGSFELDPAALPLNPDDLHFPGKPKTDGGNLEAGVNHSSPNPAERKGKSVIPESTSIPRDFGGVDAGRSGFQGSPRGDPPFVRCKVS